MLNRKCIGASETVTEMWPQENVPKTTVSSRTVMIENHPNLDGDIETGLYRESKKTFFASHTAASSLFFGVYTLATYDRISQ